MNHRRFLIVAGLLLGLVPAVQAQAQVKIEGQTFDATAQVAGTDLVLNGVGLRAVAWFKGYAAGLYLAAKATTPADALATAGPKRVQIHMLQNVDAGEFAKAVDKGIERNTPAAEHAALADRRAEFDRQVLAVGKVKKGDVANLDFVPGKGLVFSYNGKPRGAPIPGDDFYAAVLRIFLGDKPVDTRLKQGLLGGSAS